MAGAGTLDLDAKLHVAGDLGPARGLGVKRLAQLAAVALATTSRARPKSSLRAVLAVPVAVAALDRGARAERRPGGDGGDLEGAQHRAEAAELQKFPAFVEAVPRRVS